MVLDVGDAQIFGIVLALENCCVLMKQACISKWLLGDMLPWTSGKLELERSGLMTSRRPCAVPVDSNKCQMVEMGAGPKLRTRVQRAFQCCCEGRRSSRDPWRCLFLKAWETGFTGLQIRF